MPSVSLECPVLMEGSRSTKAGVVGGAGSWDPWHLGQCCQGGEDGRDSPGGIFSGGDWQFGTHGEPPGGQESKNSLMCLFLNLCAF